MSFVGRFSLSNATAVLPSVTGDAAGCCGVQDSDSPSNALRGGAEDAAVRYRSRHSPLFGCKVSSTRNPTPRVILASGSPASVLTPHPPFAAGAAVSPPATALRRPGVSPAPAVLGFRTDIVGGAAPQRRAAAEFRSKKRHEAAMATWRETWAGRHDHLAMLLALVGEAARVNPAGVPRAAAAHLAAELTVAMATADNYVALCSQMAKLRLFQGVSGADLIVDREDGAVAVADVADVQAEVASAGDFVSAVLESATTVAADPPLAAPTSPLSPVQLPVPLPSPAAGAVCMPAVYANDASFSAAAAAAAASADVSDAPLVALDGSFTSVHNNNGSSNGQINAVSPPPPPVHAGEPAACSKAAGDAVRGVALNGSTVSASVTGIDLGLSISGGNNNFSSNAPNEGEVCAAAAALSTSTAFLCTSPPPASPGASTLALMSL